MKNFLCLILSLFLLTGVLASCKKDPAAEAVTPRVAPKYEDLDLSSISSLSNLLVTDEETDYVIIKVRNFGHIVIRLFPDVAPETVANFKSLVSRHFYDGIIFHRVVSGFVVQGGDPNGDGVGGSDKNINGEFTENGFENNLHHIRGVVSMARLGNDNNSASSQFFIVHKTTQNNLESLDGKYASFGYVVYGMDVVDDIAECRTNYNDKPVVDVVIDYIRFAKFSEGNGTFDDSNIVPDNNNSSSGDSSSDSSSDSSDDSSDSNDTHTAPSEAEIDLSLLTDFTASVSETPTDYVRMKTNKGDMIIRLFPDVAPKTVDNFKKLVSEGFYNGLTFHRVIPSFMIQGGDPNGNSTGGSGSSVDGEFTENGFENNLRHVRGVISMARSIDPDSASSQFFIVHSTSEDNSKRLDGKYASFGFVAHGQEVIDAIASETTDQYDKPLTDVIINSVEFVTISK